ncbi:hypothetical protein KFU94_67990 [Chloroflexi bacterium TSY]|nr:hypothetical protein [Chloroflexi bacterium TSY]
MAAIDKLKIEVVVDPGNFVAEPKETNNSASKSVNVAPSPAANLFVRSANIGFNPRTPTEGDLVTVNAVILNTGTVDVNDVVVQFIDATDGGAVPIGIPQLISTIRNGSSGVAQILYDTTDLEGERPILVVVDPNNFIAESDEDDNQAAEILTVVPPPAPNLMVVSGNLKFEPAVPEAGEPVTMSMTVLNDGTADASEVLVQFVDITNDGAVPIGAEQVIDALPAGSSATVQVIYNNTDVPGERRIQVTVDPTDSVTESNESDNRAVKKLTITAPTEPNLSVGTGDIAFDTTNPLEGDPVVITVTVHNKGTADANNVEVTIVDITEGSDLIGGLQTIETIGAGENAEVSVTYQTGGKVGRRSIRVTVDPDNTIDESDEDDNQATKTLTVKSPEEEPADLPNLAIKSSGIVFDPTNPEPGTTVTITITVDNDGSADATDPVVKVEDVTDEDSVTLIGQKQITGTIESGESGTTSMTYDTTGLEDDRTIRVTVDPGNDIEESDEEDNVATKTLTFGSAEEEEETEDSASRNQEGSRASLHDSQQANLIVDPGDIQFERQNEERDGPLVVSATIRNIGDAAARDVMVQFVDVTDGNANLIGGAQIVASLPGRSSDMVEIRYDLHGDSVLDREIQVVLDPYNIIAEADEGDNVASRLTVADAGSDGLQVAVED